VIFSAINKEISKKNKKTCDELSDRSNTRYPSDFALKSSDLHFPLQETDLQLVVPRFSWFEKWECFLLAKDRPVFAVHITRLEAEHVFSLAQILPGRQIGKSGSLESHEQSQSPKHLPVDDGGVAESLRIEGH